MYKYQFLSGMSSNVASYKSIGLMAPLIYVNTDYNPQDVCETGRASQYVYKFTEKQQQIIYLLLWSTYSSTSVKYIVKLKLCILVIYN